MIDADGMVESTVYHKVFPEHSRWGLVTYRNCTGYPATHMNIFISKEDAIAYMRKIEPEAPLISLNGRSPSNPVPYEEYQCWKQANNFKEYDYKALCLPGGTDPKEIILQTREQFLKGNPWWQDRLRELDMDA